MQCAAAARVKFFMFKPIILEENCKAGAFQDRKIELFPLNLYLQYALLDAAC